MFDTKIAIVIRDDLAIWQKLNVTAFLTSGLVAQSPEIIANHTGMRTVMSTTR